jgi:hypothetical protein
MLAVPIKGSGASTSDLLPKLRASLFQEQNVENDSKSKDSLERHLKDFCSLREVT